MAIPVGSPSASGHVGIIDVGTGDGTKLAGLHPAFEIIGIDFGANVERSSERFPFGTWRHHDLDTDTPMPVSAKELQASVVVCSDVIERLRAAELLLAKLLGTLAHAAAVVISTPERELWHGVRTPGPPRNRHHVREWSIREFGHLLAASGFRACIDRTHPLERPDRGAVHDRGSRHPRPSDPRGSRPAADRPSGAGSQEPTHEPLDPRRAHRALRLIDVLVWLAGRP